MENEITKFTLQYDGMYHITWSEGDKVHKWYIFLDIPTLLRMLEIEGLTYDELLKREFRNSPIEFTRVTLRYTLEDGRFHAYGFFDEWLGNTLKENFVVELFVGDSLKNYKHDTILGDVELVDE
jgi:hypothetical protein